MQIYMPHQNLRCFGIRIFGVYIDVVPYDTHLQVYCNPWFKPHPRTGYRRWFNFKSLRWLCWLLNYKP